MLEVELQGHLRYRKVNNIDADRISIDMKVTLLHFTKQLLNIFQKQQQEIVMRQRMKSFAARSSVSTGGSVYSSSGSKKKSLRKSSKQYGSSNGSGPVGSNSGVSPLALPSVTDSEKVEKQTTKSVSSLPPIVDQTELEDVKEDSTLLDSGKSQKIDKKWECQV